MYARIPIRLVLSGVGVVVEAGTTRFLPVGTPGLRREVAAHERAVDSDTAFEENVTPAGADASS